MEEVADVGAAGHGGERRRRRPQALLLGVGRGRRVGRRRGGSGSSSTTSTSGSVATGCLARAGDDAAVRGPSPARVERALEACRVELDGAARLARPARAGRRLDPLDRDPARRLRGERLEACDDLVVVRRARPLRGDDAVGVAREEEASERRVAAFVRARPPDGRLVHRAGERDVEEAQVLAALLAVAEPAVPSDVGAVAADVDRPRVVVLVVVEGRRLVLVDVAGLPGERVVDDRELEALAAVDGQHLHRLGVGVEPPGALLVGAVPVGLGDPLPQPGGQRGDAELLLGRGGVQQLADVAEVGQPALAAQPREHPLGDGLGRRDRLEQRGDAAAAEQTGPAVQLRVQLLPGRPRRRRPSAPRSSRGRR